MKVTVGAYTDVGRARERNEDSYLASPPLYAVADGMGGHRGGNVASTLALEVLSHVATGGWDHLGEQVKQANHAILERARGDRTLSGMGTTLTAAFMDGEEVHLAHVGDSRAYLLRDGRLQMLTEDHTLVHQMVKQGKLTEEEAEVHPQRSILIRALGVDEPVDVDEFTLEARPADRLLLCSDGLYSMVGHDQIEQVLLTEPDPQAASHRLVELANDAGGLDNITVVILDFAEGEGTNMMPGAETASVRPSSATKELAIPTDIQREAAEEEAPPMPGQRPDDTRAHPIPQIPDQPLRPDDTQIRRSPVPPPPPVGVPETPPEPGEPHREFEARAGRTATLQQTRAPVQPGLPAEAGRNGAAGPARRRGRRVAKYGIAAVLVLALGFGGFRVYLDRQWFVGVHGGHVAIFRGLPTKVFGIHLNGLAHETTLPAARVEQLEQAWRDLPGGITAGSRVDAERIVKSMRSRLRQANREQRLGTVGTRQGAGKKTSSG